MIGIRHLAPDLICCQTAGTRPEDGLGITVLPRPTREKCAERYLQSSPTDAPLLVETHFHPQEDGAKPFANLETVGNSSIARLMRVLPRCIRMFALGAMGRLFWPSLLKKDRRHERA